MIVIRRCTNTDFDQVFALLEQLWPAKKLDSVALRLVYTRALSSDLQHYLCAVENQKIVGFCSLNFKNNLWQAGHLADIDELIVSKDHRGRGIGRALLAASIGVAKEAGCTRVELASALNRLEAHKFYQVLGFKSRAYLFSKPL